MRYTTLPSWPITNTAPGISPFAIACWMMESTAPSRTGGASAEEAAGIAAEDSGPWAATAAARRVEPTNHISPVRHNTPSASQKIFAFIRFLLSFDPETIELESEQKIL
ncbi:hypothetical protein SBA1_630015 [Candidatus Sulfotelmatobacter kueseliae]|uniref:Uncharacterized protein n=1 Tax=Candidatus Sulfotelmatobacter kueseliae TaxID=2042962 RepID=A0A2U3L2C3_9BACT|nr:hypothetical protein SBA1_630015 [Candidatus Sulfotelmatobacter kueseliae]